MEKNIWDGLIETMYTEYKEDEIPENIKDLHKRLKKIEKCDDIIQVRMQILSNGFSKKERNYLNCTLLDQIYETIHFSNDKILENCIRYDYKKAFEFYLPRFTFVRKFPRINEYIPAKYKEFFAKEKKIFNEIADFCGEDTEEIIEKYKNDLGVLTRFVKYGLFEVETEFSPELLDKFIKAGVKVDSNLFNNLVSKVRIYEDEIDNNKEELGLILKYLDYILKLLPIEFRKVKKLIMDVIAENMYVDDNVFSYLLDSLIKRDIKFSIQHAMKVCLKNNFQVSLELLKNLKSTLENNAVSQVQQEANKC